MADILTGGRVIFGVARGYHTREVESFGSPLTDQVANREIFEEGVEILFKAFEGKPFSHKGKFYTIPPEVPYRGYTLKEITLVPAPERLPVECWQPIQSGSDRAFDFMAKHGISGMIGGGSAEGGAVERHMLGFQAAYARRGKTLRGEHEDVRRVAPRTRALRRSDRGDARSQARRRHQIAAYRGRGEGRRVPDRDARRHHRAAEGGREALSRSRSGGVRHAARYTARCPAGRSGPVRDGSDPGVP